MMSLSLVSSSTYIAYRLTYTLRFETLGAATASLLVFFAELYGIFLMFLYFWQIWETTPVGKKPPLPGRSVDVLVPTYDEDVQLLHGTLQSMVALDYPHNVYVLDDGNRPEVAALAEKLGVHYIARDNNLHAKAGNLNNALNQTTGEFVAVFDADHIVRRHFLTTTLGHFEDESVAFVQTPHSFYNFDSYSSTYSPHAADYWEEGDLFHHCVQNGKANANANVFCGSAAIFRRRALEDVGLIATETITEDMHTGLRLHARGWKSVSLDERLVAAQAAPDVTAYQTQRLRWGEGNLSILRHDNPLTMPGLTLTQRVHYVGSVLGWTTGLARLVLYLTPMAMLTMGIQPFANVCFTLVLLVLCHVVFSYVALKVSGDGHFRIWRNELGAMTSFWVHVRAVWRVVIGKRSRFKVTSKRGGETNEVLRCIWPQVTLFGIGIASMTWGGFRVVTGIDSSITNVAVSMMLVSLQLICAGVVIRKGLRPRDKRFSCRHHSGKINVGLKWNDMDGVEMSAQAVCVDINERGVQLHVYTDILASQPLEILFHTPEYSIPCSGHVVWVDKSIGNSMSGTSYRIGLCFDELDTSTTDALWCLSMEKVVSEKYRQYRQSASMDCKQVCTALPIRITQELAPGELTTSCGVVNEIADDYLEFDCGSTDPGSESVCIEIATPLGLVRGRGRVTAVPSADDPDKKRLLGVRYETQGQALVNTVRRMASSKSSSQIVTCPEKPPKISWMPSLRAAVPLTAAIAVIILFSFPFVHSDAWLLTKYRLGWYPAGHQSERVDSLLAQVEKGTPIDPVTVRNLRNALMAMGRSDDAFVVLQHLVLAEPDNADLMIAVADEHLKRGDAERAFPKYLEWYTRFPQARNPLQVLMAIRTGIAVNRMDETSQLLVGLQNFQSLDRDILLECVGLALQIGDTQKALAFASGFDNADGVPNLKEEGMAVMAIHSARHDWNAALATADSLYSAFPESCEVLTAIAECNLWASNYAAAARHYEASNSITALKDINRARWADALLQCGNPDQALALWQPEDVSPLWHSILLDAMAPTARLNTPTPLSHFNIDIEEIITDAMGVPVPDERLIRAVVQHLTKDDPRAALSYLERHDETVCQVSDLLYHRADLAYLNGDYSTSLTDAQEVRSMEASGDILRHNAQVLIARSLGQMGQTDDSIKHFEQAASTRSGNVELLIEAAGAALTNDQASEALRLCDLAESRSSKNLEVKQFQEHRGDSQSVSGHITVNRYSLAHFTDTTEDFEHPIQLDILNVRIAALSSLGRWQEVTRHCEHFLKNYPDNLDVRQAYAENLLWSGHLNEGIKSLRTLQSGEPADCLEDALFARALVWGGEYQEGLATLLAFPDWLQRSPPIAADVISAALGCKTLTPQQQMRVRSVIDAVITMSRDNTASHSDLATVTATEYLLRIGDYQTVIQWISQLQDRSTISSTLRLSLAEAYRMTGQHTTAGHLYDELIHDVLEPNGPHLLQESAFGRRVMISAARNAHQCGNSSEALASYQTLYQTGTCSTTEICEYAAVLLATGNAEKAADVFPKASDITPQQTQLYVDILLTTGNLAQAMMECQSLLEQNPYNTDNLVRLANIYSAQKEIQSSVVTWKKIAETSSMTRSQRSQYAVVLSWAKEYNYAINEFHSVLDSGSLPVESQQAFLLAISGSTIPVDTDITRELNRIDEEYRQRTNIDPKNVEFLVYAQVRTGNYAAAQAHLKRLVSRDSKRIDLKLLLVDTLQELGDFEAANSILAPLVSDQVRNLR